MAEARVAVLTWQQRDRVPDIFLWFAYTHTMRHTLTDTALQTTLKLPDADTHVQNAERFHTCIVTLLSAQFVRCIGEFKNFTIIKVFKLTLV